MPDAQTALVANDSTADASQVGLLQKLASTRLLVAALPLPAIASFATGLSDAKFIAICGCATALGVAYIVANTLRPTR